MAVEIILHEKGQLSWLSSPRKTIIESLCCSTTFRRGVGFPSCSAPPHKPY